MKIAVFCQIWPAALEQLQRHYDCAVVVKPDTETKHRLLADAEVVVLRSPVVLDGASIEVARSLQLVVRAGMGLDNIDQAALRQRDIGLVTVPLSAQSVAELTFGLMLALHRRIPWLDQSLRAGRWEKHAYYGRELAGQTLGLLGFGRIGRCTAAIARAFGMTLLAFDRSPEKLQKQQAAAQWDVRFVALDDLFTASDIVAIQVPLNRGTRHLIGSRLIGQMRPDAVLINVGRGQVVDEQALYDALRQQAIGGAALDVFGSEPAVGNPLLELDNFVGTPHVGAQTVEAQQKVGEDVVRIVNAFRKGEPIGRTGSACSPLAKE